MSSFFLSSCDVPSLPLLRKNEQENGQMKLVISHKLPKKYVVDDDNDYLPRLPIEIEKKKKKYK